MFRRRGAIIEVLLVHPGGPFFWNKDDGSWTIPKGEVAAGENLLQRAQVEFEEELGVQAPGECIELGLVKQKGGKRVYGWALEGDLAEDFRILSNSFKLEWPPRSGKISEFPEVDRAEFFPIEIAKQKINPAQRAFLDRLAELVAKT